MCNQSKRLLETLTRIMNKTSSVMAEPRNFGTEHMLYTSEIQMVNVIGRTPGINVTEIADKLGITKGAVPKIIRKLIQKELIFRYQSSNNKKVIHFELTDKGKIAFQQHIEFHQKVNNGIIQHFGAMSPEEFCFLNDLMVEIEEHLDKIKQEG